MPTLTWRCNKTACENEFDSSKAAPKCPKCKSTRVSWVPRRLNYNTTAGRVDRTVASLAESINMQGLRSPQRGEAMRARVVDAPVSPYTPRGTSFTGNVRYDGRASCSVSPQIAVAGLPTSVKLPTKRMPKLRQVTKIEGVETRRVNTRGEIYVPSTQ